MSLTSYRAAPPRGGMGEGGVNRPRDVGIGILGRAQRVGLCCVHGRPGGDLLSRALRRSTIGAAGFHGRVRDGIGCWDPRYGHQTVDERSRDQGTGIRDQVTVFLFTVPCLLFPEQR